MRWPDATVFLPALMLLSYWVGGEGLLIFVAGAIPTLFFAFGALHRERSSPPLDDRTELSPRPQVLRALDNALQEQDRTGACLVVQFDESALMLDLYGRSIQTEILARSAERLCRTLRYEDTVARLEGGGFAIALSPVRRLDLESLVQMAARLQAALAPPIEIKSARIYVSCSIGFCLTTRAPEPCARSILDAAQIAADEALRYGPGAIRAFSPEMARHRSDRDAYRETLEAALDNGDIRPHFQPQICTDTGTISGFEALARWHHPDRGVVPPAEFLPALEEAGLSERLGEVILNQSLNAMVRWEKAGLKVPTVAVNFSALELRNPRLVEKLGWELDRFDLTPDRLSIEILETVIAQTDNDLIVRNISALAQLGCGIDLDDFGTGHASITNIRRFAVRRLKIDRSFVTRVDEDREQQQMVAAILSLAEQLGLKTLAEGVETSGEHAMLSQLGCGHVQGFGIARPMPFEDTHTWIARHETQLAQAPRINFPTQL